jgi:hypothetical protein
LISAGTSPGASNLASGLATASTQIAIPTIGAPLYTDLFIRVTAANAYGVGLPSEEIDILLTPFCAGPPSPPDELVATINGFNASFNWAASAGETFGYRFDGGVAPGATQFSVRTTAPTLSAGAPSSGVFYTRVRGVGGCGTSTASNELMVIVGGVERPPSAPQGLGANIGSFTLVTVSWAPPASGVATSYRLDVGTGFGLSNVASITTTATSLSYRGVPRGWYYFRVYAIGATGISPASDEVIFFVP